MIGGPISKQLDRVIIGDVTLTLASWDTGYGPSYEIGYREKDFHLIQFRMPRQKAWNIVKRLVTKNKPIEKIQRIIMRIDL